MKYKIIDFLDEINNNCSHIVFLSVKHILNKIYDNIENQEVQNKEELLKIVKNYSFVLRYLNDFAGIIYRKYDTSVEAIYLELCDFYNFNSDNEYIYEHTINKLKKQTPVLFMSLTDEDIKIKTIENFCEKLDKIKISQYYLSNIKQLQVEVQDLQKNIDFVKMASNYNVNNIMSKK
jgi:hypothetical protein